LTLLAEYHEGSSTCRNSAAAVNSGFLGDVMEIPANQVKETRKSFQMLFKMTFLVFGGI